MYGIGEFMIRKQMRLSTDRLNMKTKSGKRGKKPAQRLKRPQDDTYTARSSHAWLEVLKNCPVPMDDLPQRNREYPKKLHL